LGRKTRRLQLSFFQLDDPVLKQIVMRSNTWTSTILPPLSIDLRPSEDVQKTLDAIINRLAIGETIIPVFPENLLK